MSRTLYMETYGLSLRKSDETLSILKQGRPLHQCPAIAVEAVVVFADGVSISGGAVRLCQSHSIPIFFMSGNGCGPSVLAPAECRWPDRQVAQIRACESPERVFAVCRGIVTGKVRNQLSLMKYYGNSGRSQRFADAVAACENEEKAVRSALSDIKPDAVPGEMRTRFFNAEARVARKYWQAVAALVRSSAEFPGRHHQGACDPVNSLLNYGYAILRSRVHHAILRSGLSTCFSFLHAIQDGRPSLVFDMMEEFRAWGVDRVVLSMLGRGRKVALDGKGRISSADRRFLIEQLEKRWKKDGLNKLLDCQLKGLRRVTEHGEAYSPLFFRSNGSVCRPNE
ncbi:CRISPR-associated endonuclease Cas1 [Desulfonema ishimotonii]|uniref:CRISPR-associated endonuclease Cas1 n=1 Tax=Desulfonema ishimotonii TaxID=45657 RepID=A0A401FT51_9BACT|nr:CRISPR-associated endonuclease Cas1 [Desulfonema ishimotonii]GBC60130.1 CRISPR-associated endonuclease Cas1 [Desulfonema ishimotonii]